MLVGFPPLNRSLVFLLVALPISLPLQAQEAQVPRTRTFSGLVAPAFPYTQPEEAGLSSARLDWLGDEIVSWVAAGELVGAELLIVKGGRAVFHEAYGWSDRERRLPVERNSIWWIGGASKPFVATAVLALVEEGKLSLDDPLSRYIPGFAGDARTTIRHLLTHTSGFSERSGLEEQGVASLEEWIVGWAAEGPTRPFGQFYNSDFSFHALAHVVSLLSGRPVDVFIKERIIEPLRLADTSTGFSADPAWRARLNPFYRWNERAREYDLRSGSDRPGWRYYLEGLFCTAMDVAQFVGMWLKKGEWNGARVLSPETVEEALKVQVRDDVQYGYGYGWYIHQSHGTEGPPWNFHHWGRVGVQTIAFPRDDAIVVYLTHSRWGPHHDAFWNRLGMSGLFDGSPGPDMLPASERRVPEVSLSSKDRTRYAGAFAAGERAEGVPEVVGVWEENDRLHVRMGPSGIRADLQFDLVPLGDDRFALGRYADDGLRGVDPDFTLRFVLKDDVAVAVDVLEGDEVQTTAQRIR